MSSSSVILPSTLSYSSFANENCPSSPSPHDPSCYSLETLSRLQDLSILARSCCFTQFVANRRMIRTESDEVLGILSPPFLTDRQGKSRQGLCEHREKLKPQSSLCGVGSPMRFLLCGDLGADFLGVNPALDRVLVLSSPKGLCQDTAPIVPFTSALPNF